MLKPRRVTGAPWSQCHRLIRYYSTPTSSDLQSHPDELITEYYEKPRINPVGIQHLSSGLQQQLFRDPNSNTKITESKAQLVKLSHQHLIDHELLGKKCSLTPPINFRLPKLQGRTLDEHFHKLGSLSSQKYLELIKGLLHSEMTPPARPDKWEFKSGWTRYKTGEDPTPVPFPTEDALVFDVETLYKISKYPVLATAYTPDAWYGWVSPFLTRESDTLDHHLIPLDTHSREKVIIGHNVSYDRARILEEYDMTMSKAFFMDTMSFHVAVSGMCSRQRGSWLKYKKKKETDTKAQELESIRSTISDPDLQHLIDNSILDMDQNSDDSPIIDDPWMKSSSLNSLAHVAELHTGIKMSKEIRDDMATEDPDLIRNGFQDYMNYCAGDVWATFKVFTKIFPQFQGLVPHPASLAALRHITQSFLPVTKEWNHYITNTENMYQESLESIESKLHEICESVVNMKDDPSKPWETDPWLSQLDWTMIPPKLTKKGVPFKNQKLPGFPEWYKQLIIKNKLKLTSKSRVSPLLLKLEWENKPIYWIDDKGWCFLVQKDEVEEFKNKNYTHFEDETFFANSTEINHEVEEILRTKSIFKIPHENGPTSRTTNLMAKSFLKYFEKGTLTSKYKIAEEAFKQAVSNSYWSSSRERITSQFVVYNNKDHVSFDGNNEDIGMIIPQIIPMGTVTRRAVERTWLTASNAKSSRLGSELKSMVKAPPGYCFVGADVDSEELWIASLVGDSVFKLHGGTAIGWMTLEGAKSEGTDLHSKTANILGISRNEAKVFNYGRIYGAGVKFATTLLKKFNPSLLEDVATTTAKKLYAATKGKTNVIRDRKIWYGGSESIVFNRLEQIADQENPKTPVLGAGITSALRRKNLNSNSFLPSRINWAIQSSGVDYLHLLIVSIEYLSKVYHLDMRLCITVHDEIRYMVKNEEKYKAAMILQIANLWTRAMFCQQLGIDEVPQSCAFFSAVDIDHVLRKEVDLPCVTPSHPEAIAPGESLDIYALLQKPGIQKFLESVDNPDLSNILYRKKQAPMSLLDEESDSVAKALMIQLQILKEPAEFTKIKKMLYNHDELRYQDQFAKDVVLKESFNERVVCDGTFGEIDLDFEEMVETFKKIPSVASSAPAKTKRSSTKQSSSSPQKTTTTTNTETNTINQTTNLPDEGRIPSLTKSMSSPQQPNDTPSTVASQDSNTRPVDFLNYETENSRPRHSKVDRF